MDNTDTTNRLLAYGISTRINHTLTPFSEDGVHKILESSGFSPTCSARWINALFFVSLISSLAAAFFGIIAKQWLREYMKWNSALASPRENVLVRQIRFEAWEAWHVAATISSIPALLELGMILFLIGVIVLLWSLDDVVAIVATVVVAFFLGCAAAFTLLPVIFKHCPYKSRTAWACTIIVDFIQVPFRFSLELYRATRSQWLLQSRNPLRLFSRAARMVRPFTTQPKSWREWDMKSSRVSSARLGGRFSRSQDVREAARTELRKERSHIGPDGRVWDSLLPVQVDDSTYEAADVLIEDIGQTTLLLRALVWVQRASQDVRIHQHVDRCLESIHADATPLPDSGQVPILTNWLLLLSTHTDGLKRPYKALLPSSLGDPRPYMADLSVTGLRQELGVRAYPPMSSEQDEYTFTRRSRSQRLDSYVKPDSHFNSLLFRIFVLSLRSSLSDLQAALQNQNYGEHWMCLQVRRIVELFSTVHDMAGLMSWWRTSWYIDGLHTVLRCSSMARIELDAKAPGLRLATFKQAQLHARVFMDPNKHEFGELYSSISLNLTRLFTIGAQTFH